MPKTLSQKPYRVGRSRTGLGLFATKPIGKGSFIVRYSGPLLDAWDDDAKPVDNKYLFYLNSRWTINGSGRRNVARYINHSCKPNAETEVNSRARKVFICAIADIKAGEEITYDYGREYFNAYLKSIGCKCAACEQKRKKRRAKPNAPTRSVPGKRKNSQGKANRSYRPETAIPVGARSSPSTIVRV
jgi:SET domain-containing protein